MKNCTHTYSKNDDANSPRDTCWSLLLLRVALDASLMGYQTRQRISRRCAHTKHIERDDARATRYVGHKHNSPIRKTMHGKNKMTSATMMTSTNTAPCATLMSCISSDQSLRGGGGGVYPEGGDGE
eukprot:COSAG02_NODE_1714_length_11220_cov_3.198543_12_plen_126_part_00